jgi:diguanylate cyclase (GGDEF)-like protein
VPGSSDIGPPPGRVDDALAAALRLAETVDDACTAVVDHLVAIGLAMPSLYLERGGRLRCYAVRGYWQVFDGMPADAGVIGRTYRTGQPSVIRGVTDAAHYLQAVPGIVDEICVPIQLGSHVVGALNVESTTGLDAGCLDALSLVTAAFADRLTELGGPPQESPAQRLARHATALACVEELFALEAAVLRAATDLSGMDSAVLVRLLPGGLLRVSAAAGAVGRDFATTAGHDALAHIASWVEQGTSSWSLGDPDGYGFSGHEALKAAGAAAVVVVPLAAAGERLGLLMVAHRDRMVPPTEVVELVELLGAHAGTCLRTLQVIDELRLQASRDPLTGLGHHATYQAALSTALAMPAHDQRVAVVMLDLDGFKSVNDGFGHLVGDRLLRDSARVLATALRREDRLFRVGGDEFAAVLPVDGVEEAFAVAQRMHAAVRTSLPGTTVSVGVALALPGEDAASVVSRADAALYAVKRGGRDGVRLAAGPDEQLRPAAG